MKILLVAKAPIAGRVKTRLCPPLTPEQAAIVAAAALRDTLGAVLASRATEVVLAFDGDPEPWIPAGLRVHAQRGASFAQRLTNAWDDCGGPTLQIGMDTPQVSTELLDDAMRTLAAAPGRAVLGLAEDGGWWGLGMHAPHPEAFQGIVMSTPDTGQAQRCRLQELGGPPVLLPTLRDVDTWQDALAVSELSPGSAFAAAVADCRSGPLAEPLTERR